MDIPELKELAELLPERNAEGRFFWQDYVDRIAGRFDGLPAPDGGESFVRACLAAGCRAVPVMERNVLWKNRAPPQSEGRARAVFEFRVRLGLFLAASLRYLAHGVCRLRAGTGDAEWHPLDGGEASFRAFLEAHGGEPGIAWRKTTPDYGQVCLCALFFFQRQEVLLVSPVLAREVLGFLDPDKAAGLFGRMLVHDGQVEGEDTDAAGVFLEAMVQAVERKRLRVNTRANGHLFVTPAFWLLTSPVGVGDVLATLRSRRQGRRYDFTRHEVFRALVSAGCLVDGKTPDNGHAAKLYEINSTDWDEPLSLRGVAILPGSLPASCNGVPQFRGTVTLKKENADGSNAG